MIRQKPGLKLRKVGRQYMIVRLADNNVNLSEVYTLNETSARLWERLGMDPGEDITIDALADWLCGEYEVDRWSAISDVTEQIDEWKEFGLITM